MVHGVGGLHVVIVEAKEPMTTSRMKTALVEMLVLFGAVTFLLSSSTGAIQVPASVTIAAGASRASFTVRGIRESARWQDRRDRP